jgi:small GTP-binding protein
MNPKQKIDAAVSGAQEAAANAAHDAAAAAADAAEQIKTSVKDMFPKDMLHSKKDILPSKTRDMHVPENGPDMSFLTMPYLGVMIALFVVLISILFLFRRPLMGFCRRLRGRTGKTTVLIFGPLDAGKTVLFYTLANGKFQQTQTSMQENVDTFKIHQKILDDANKPNLSRMQFEFIDFPGHPSQELKRGKYLPRANGVVLLVDAASNESINNGSKMLFSLLENKDFINKKTPILVCANKSDLDQADNVPAIRSKILAELNKLKESGSSMENIEHSGDEQGSAIGKSGEKLTWDSLGAPISFGRISVKKGEMRDLLDFFEGIQKKIK